MLFPLCMETLTRWYIFMFFLVIPLTDPRLLKAARICLFQRVLQPKYMTKPKVAVKNFGLDIVYFLEVVDEIGENL
jgi:hypothetical protein